MVRLLLLIFLLIIFNLSSSGQYYSIGQEPTNIKWKEIRTENFQLVFPSLYEPHAQKAALLFEQWRLPLSKSLNAIPPFTPVVLHTGNVYSNAYSAWAPRRLELLTIPPQDIYSQTWINQLVLHEYRHMVQITKVNQGFTRFLSVILGEQAAPGIIGLFVPSWFMEGDAVAAETAFSFSGRGRMADFALPLRAQIIEKGKYNYAKATLGSYKDFVPNSYILGYHIVAAARAKYGYEIWDTAMDRTGKKPYTLNPFSKGIEIISGLNKGDLYDQSMQQLDSLWQSNYKTTKLTSIRIPAESTYHNYLHPFYFNKGVISLKSSLNDVEHFVFIDSIGKETIIHTPGFLFEDEVSFNGNTISWIERRPNPRWETQGYSTIVLLNAGSGKVNRIKTRLRLFSPDINSNNTTIVLSEVNEKGDNYLTFLDLKGTIINRASSPSNLYISSPSWSPDSKEVAVILTSDKGKQLAIYNIQTNSFKFISPVIADVISDVKHHGTYVHFSMDVNERNEICTLDTLSKEIRLLTQSKFGSKHPWSMTEQGRLLFSYYTADGYRIASAGNKALSYKLLEFSNNNTWPLGDNLGAQEVSLAETILPNDSMVITKYRKGSNLFKFHSWAPAYVDIEDQTVRPGISVFSQNLLSTMFLTAGYDYDVQEETGSIKGELSWRGWFPVITTSIVHGNRSSMYGHGDTAYRFTWRETSFDLAAGIPLNTTSGKYSIGSYLEIKHQLLRSAHNSTTPDNFRSGVVAAINYTASVYALEKRAYRDLASRFGISAEAHFKHTPYGDFVSGNLFSFQNRIYLPGLFMNHSLQVYSAYQLRETSDDRYRFAGDLSLPSGYDGSVAERIIRLRPSYSVPLVYPDYTVGTFLYIKRLRANLFYDIAWQNENNKWNTLNSIGYDLIADYHIFTLPAPLTTGIRAAWLTDKKEMTFSLIFSLDLAVY